MPSFSHKTAESRFDEFTGQLNSVEHTPICHHGSYGQPIRKSDEISDIILAPVRGVTPVFGIVTSVLGCIGFQIAKPFVGIFGFVLSYPYAGGSYNNGSEHVDALLSFVTSRIRYMWFQITNSPARVSQFVLSYPYDGASRLEFEPAKFRLTDLPDEILLELMGILPTASLYCLRQTSTKFMALFQRQELSIYHRDAFPSYYGRPKLFAVDKLRLWEARAIADSLNQHTRQYCKGCVEKRDSGDLETTLTELQDLRYCNGCNEPHVNALFFPEDRKRHDRDSSPISCIGRMGNVDVCNHNSCETVTWQSLEEYVQLSGQQASDLDYPCACTDRSHRSDHKMMKKDSNDTNLSVFPRLLMMHRGNSSRSKYMVFGWDAPLLEVDRYGSAPLSRVQRILSSMIADTIRNGSYRLCPHVSIEKLRDIVRTRVCVCFTKGSGDKSWERSDAPCEECQIRHSFGCPVCGAMYRLHLRDDIIMLSLRYRWQFSKPTSLAWLCLLSERHRMRVFGRDTRRVLWCDTPGCQTNERHRWEAIVKEDAEVNRSSRSVTEKARSEYST